MGMLCALLLNDNFTCLMSRGAEQSQAAILSRWHLLLSLDSVRPSYLQEARLL